MDLHTIKKTLQDHFTDGLVTVVGCGLSMAEGIPGMGELGQYLKEKIPERVKGTDLKPWLEIVNLLDNGKNIEEAMLQCPPTPEIEIHIVDLAAELILNAENVIIAEIFGGTKILRFSKLLSHIIKPNIGIPIITTNYDRLIEFAAEIAGFGVDTLFVGQHFSKLNEKESKLSFCRDLVQKRERVYLKYAHKVLIFKPHGSLDWFLLGDEPIRCPFQISKNRLIITPGRNKFRTGYDRPFDKHREKANEWIDRASRYLLIGYGFNDDHLETHLSKNLREGRPALVLTHTLSPNATKLIEESPGMIAIAADQDKRGACILMQGEKIFIPDIDIWDLGIFVKEVLEP